MGKIAFQRRFNALPATGDFVTGGGPSTLQRSNPNVLDNEASLNSTPGMTVAPALHGAPWAQPVVIWVGILALLIAAKYAAERGGDASEFSSIRIGFWNFWTITIIAILGENFAKWIFGYWRIPGVSTLVLAS